MSSAGAVSFPLSGDRRTARIRQASSFGGHHLRRSRTRPLCRPCCKSLSWIASPPKCWPLPTLSPAGPSLQSCPRISARQSRVSSRYTVSLCDTAFSHPCIHAARSIPVPASRQQPHKHSHVWRIFSAGPAEFRQAFGFLENTNSFAGNLEAPPLSVCDARLESSASLLSGLATLACPNDGPCKARPSLKMLQSALTVCPWPG